MLRGFLARIAVVGLAAAALGWGSASAQTAPPRFAWVVGETAYVGDMLPTTANDATLIARTLAGEGFDVTEQHDLNTPALSSAYSDFLAKVRAAPPGAAVTVYLTGLGVAVGCDDYLLPIDAQIRSAADVPRISLSMQRVMNDLAASNAQVKVVALDASRPVPPSVSSVAFPKGLIPLAPPLATAFALGAEIHDYELQPQAGDSDDVYAPALASALQQPLFDIDATLKAARLAAHQSSAGAQTPWHAVGANMPAFAYSPTATAEQAQQALAAMPAAPGSLQPLGPDGAYWASIWRNTIADYQAFLGAFSTSADPNEVAHARALLALLTQPNPICQGAVAPAMQPVYSQPVPVYEGPAVYEGPICPEGFAPTYVNGVDYCAPIRVEEPCPFGTQRVRVDGDVFCRVVSVCPPDSYPRWNGHGWACHEPCRWDEDFCPCPPGDPRCHRPPECRPGMPGCAPIGCPPGTHFVEGVCRPFGGGGGPGMCPPGEIRINDGPCVPVRVNPPVGPACPPGEMRVGNGPCVQANHPVGPGGQNACPNGEIKLPSGACGPAKVTPPTPTPTLSPIHTPGPTPTLGPIHTPGPTPTLGPIHTPGPTPTLGPIHTPGPTPTLGPIHTPGPTPTLAPIHTPGPTPTHTFAPPPVVHTPAPPPVVHTPAPPPVMHTTAPPPVIHTQAPPPVVHTQAPPPVAHTQAPVAMPPQNHGGGGPAPHKCGGPNEPKC